MAVFRPTNESNVCTLNFDDKLHYEIPLHEENLAKIKRVADEQKAKLSALDKDSESAINELYNSLLDAIDEILGEDAGANIMGIFNNPGVLEAGEVICFIVKEFTLAYHARLNKAKADASLPEGTVAPQGGKRGRR